MDKQFASAERRMSGIAGIFISANVSIQEPQFAVFEQCVTILKVGTARADGFNLRAGQDNAGFQPVLKEVIVAGGPIERSIALPGGYGVTLNVFGLIRLSLMSGLAGHGSLLSGAANFLC